jgi:hypothetical protein
MLGEGVKDIPVPVGIMKSAKINGAWLALEDR